MNGYIWLIVLSLLILGVVLCLVVYLNYIKLLDIALNGIKNQNSYEDIGVLSSSIERPLFKYFTKNNSITDIIFTEIEFSRLNEINRTLGVKERKDLIEQIIKRIKSKLDSNDIIFKNEEDIITIMTPITSELNKEIFSERISDLVKLLDKEVELKESNIKIALKGVNVGYTYFPKDGSDFATIKNNALRARIKSRSNVTGSITCYSCIKDTHEENKLYYDIINGMDNNDFILYYQPQYDIKNAKIIGYEALVRWKRGNKLVAPNDFIPFIEKNDLIYRMGNYIINEAYKNYHKLPDKTILSINISAKQLKDDNLLKNIFLKERLYNVNPSTINFEITETVAIEDFDTVFELLSKLRDRGYKISIDDFGVGYSSLSYISKLPITHIKVDKSFIDNIYKDVKTPVMLKTIIKLAQGLNLKVIVEGVETMEHFKYLRDLGCDEVQGYLISKPTPLTDIITEFHMN